MCLLGVKQLADPYYQGFAAQIAFFLLMSLVPTLILVSQLLGVMEISMNYFESFLEKYMSTRLARELLAILENRPTVGNNIFLIALAVWSASRAQFALMRIANYTYSGGRKTGTFFRERLRSLKTMALFVLTLGAVAVVLVYGQLILKVLLGRVLQDSVLRALWKWLRWPLTAALYFLVVLYLYITLPVDRLPVREVVPGAVISSVGMIIVTFIFAIYTGNVTDYGLIYGSLSSIVALLTWFYFLSWVLVIGILFNKVWKDTK